MLAITVDKLAIKHLGQPGTQFLYLAHLFATGQELEYHILYQIFGIRLVIAKPEGQLIQVVEVRLNELFKLPGGFITGFRSEMLNDHVADFILERV